MELEQIAVSKINCQDHAQRIELNEEKMLELVASIRAEGLNQPICLTKKNEGYTVVFGHRRLEACKRLGWQKVPAFIAVGDEATLRKMTFSENFFRADLTPIELAVAIAEEYKTARMTVEQLAAGFQRSTDWVRRQIAICGWPEDVLEAIHLGKISTAAAANLACIEEEQYRKMLVKQACENGATARTTAAWLQGWRAMLPMEEAIQQEPDPAQQQAQPLIPKAPCLACGDIYRPDEMSYVPLCQRCCKLIRDAQ